MSNCVNFSAGGGVPIGTIISFMGTTPPADYLACDGSTKNITDYPQLADFFEAQFGSNNYFGGDGTTTFAVPDLQGEFLRGTGTNNHTNQGSGGTVGQHQDGTSQPYIWFYKDGIFVINKTTSSSESEFPLNVDSKVPYQYVYEANKTRSYAENAPDGRYTSRPTNTSVLYCIKAIAYTD